MSDLPLRRQEARTVKYLCLACRVVAQRSSVGQDRPVCPECRVEMRYMGTRWRPPKRRDRKAWRSLAVQLGHNLMPEMVRTEPKKNVLGSGKYHRTWGW